MPFMFSRTHSSLPGLRVDRDDRSVAAAAVDHAARDDRTAHGLAVRVAPRDLELIDVGLVDLFRREVARVVRTIPVSMPPLARGGLRQARRDGGKDRRESHSRYEVPPESPDSLRHHELLLHCRTGPPEGGHYFLRVAALLPRNANAPSSPDVTRSITPSLFRSTASTCEPAPDWLCTSSGTNSAPPGACLLRTVR